MDKDILRILEIETRILDDLGDIRESLSMLEKETDVRLVKVWQAMFVLIAELIASTAEVSLKLQNKNEVSELLKSLQDKLKEQGS